MKTSLLSTKSDALPIPIKARKLMVRSLVTIMTLALCFVGAELLLDKYYSEGQSQNWSKFDPQLGWSLVPGDYWNKPLRDLHRIGIHINELGVRSDPQGAESSAQSSVVILGDSFVFAKQTSNEESFPQRLENLLNEKLQDRISVVNAGVPGYGTGQELLQMRQLHTKLDSKPAVYLLMFFTNDILDNLCLSYGDLKFQPVRPCFTLDDAGEAVLTRLPEDLPGYEDDALVAARNANPIKVTYITRAWVEEWIQGKGEVIEFLNRFGVTPRVGRMPGLMNAWYREDVLKTGLPITAALIAKLNEEVKQQGGELLISMVPSPFQIYPETYIPLLQESFPGNAMVEAFASDIERPQRLMREMCLKAGVSFQDLLPILAQHREAAMFIPRDGHLTRIGHKITSEALLPFVLEHMPESGHTLSHVIGRP